MEHSVEYAELLANAFGDRLRRFFLAVCDAAFAAGGDCMIVATGGTRCRTECCAKLHASTLDKGCAADCAVVEGEPSVAGRLVMLWCDRRV